MTKTPISRSEPLDVGDIVELHFGSFGGTWIKAMQIAGIEAMLKHEKRWKTKSWEIRDDGRTVVFEVEVLKTNPVVITAGAIVASIISLALIVGVLLTFFAAYKPIKKVAEILKTPVGATLGIAAAVLVGAIAFGLFKK